MATSGNNATEGLAGLLAWNTLGIAGARYQGLRLRLDLFDETVFMTRYESGRPSRVYEVSPLDLAAAFADIEISTPVLPKRCLFWQRKGGEERLGVYLPPQVWGLWLAGRKRRARVPLPGLVFVGQGKTYQIWAVNHPRSVAQNGEWRMARDWQPCGTDRLYKAPLPNVNPKGKDSGVCQGDASGEFPKASAKTIYDAVGALFDTQWSDHWIDGKSIEKPGDVRKVYPRARRLGYWPGEDLVETRLVLGDVVRDA